MLYAKTRKNDISQIIIFFSFFAQFVNKFNKIDLFLNHFISQITEN